jgi:hypothetical protein
MARTFGSVVTRKHNGKTRFGLRFRIDGKEFHSWSVPIGDRKIGYSSRDLAEGVLEEIRSDIRRGIDPLAAVSPTSITRRSSHSIDSGMSGPSGSAIAPKLVN